MSHGSAKTSSGISEIDAQPLPNDFVNYFPWACGQFQLGIEISISKMVQSEYVGSNIVGAKARRLKLLTNPLKAHISRMEIVSETGMKKFSENFEADPVIKLTAFCNRSDKLIHLRIEKTEFHIPRKLLKILGLFVRFHPYLVTFTIKTKIDKYVVYELSKLISISNISELYLDGCYVRECNFDILLCESCGLKILSLARCSLTDTILKPITDKLDLQEPGARLLTSLNLSSNRITDVGARYVAKALRSNRRLVHLNLSGNSIGDEGAFAIFATMLEFVPTEDELVKTRVRRFQYLIDKIEMVNNLVVQFTEEEFDKLRRKTTKASSKGLFPEYNVPRISRAALDPGTIRRIHDRAGIQADMTLGKFIDPFYPFILRKDVVCSYGSNALLSLNLAYNNLTVLSVRKSLETLLYQKSLNRRPRGLINLNLEGNNFPVACPELHDINSLMEEAVAETSASNSPVYKKKASSKSDYSIQLNV